MNQEKFSFQKATDYVFNNKGEIDIDTTKEYIKKFFIPLTNGNHIFVQCGKAELIDTETLKRVYFNRMHKKMNTFYFNEYIEIKEPVCEIGKPFLFDDKVNMIGKFKHKKSPYINFPEEVRSSVDKVLKLIKEVWANNNEKVYTYIVKWFANMIQGNKNQTIPYLKGIQGIGKSTITELIMNHVIGNELSLVTGSGPLKEKFNLALMGQLMVVFEELENFNKNEWSVISSRLKRECTSKISQYEGKGKDPIKANNINNYIVLSNNDAIKDDDGRRYVVLDLSNKYKGDLSFWKSFYKECVNDKVGEAFYNYLLEVDLSDYSCENIPHTQSKDDAIVKRLDTVALFLKEMFVLKKKEIKHSLMELYTMFSSFCSTQNKNTISKIDFNKKMKEYKINSYKSNSSIVVKVKEHDLLKIAKANKWLHETDDFSDKQPEKKKEMDDYYLKLEDKNIELENIIEQMKQVDEMKEAINKRQAERLKEMTKVLQMKYIEPIKKKKLKVFESEDEPEDDAEVDTEDEKEDEDVTDNFFNNYV